MTSESRQPKGKNSANFTKNALFSSLIAVSLISAQSAEAGVLDVFKGAWNKIKATDTVVLQDNIETKTVKTLELLGGEDLQKSIGGNTFLQKVLDDNAGAFAVDTSISKNSLDQAIEDEQGHVMDEISVYTVRKGDTLPSIASYFEVSPETISTFNDLENDKVVQGQVLEIPAISGILYTTKKGDSLDKIATLYKVNADDVVLYNGLVFGADLAEGDEVFLPGAKSLPVIKKDTSKDTKIAAKTTTKKVTNTTKKDTMSATTAISKIKRFAGKYSDLPVYDGYYANPAPSARRSQKMHGANAVDLAAPIGTDILASAPGTVSVAKSTGWNYGYGQYIVITHPNGTQTVYAHLSNINVSVGQSVSRGQKIGDMGSTGNSTGPHVHFEVRGAYNPFAW
jgi:murein DD-endopeptidase MepM/ murein hydrolase activator NlpD